MASSSQLLASQFSLDSEVFLRVRIVIYAMKATAIIKETFQYIVGKWNVCFSENKVLKMELHDIKRKESKFILELVVSGWKD
mgnify:CR=1 FL=1